MATDLKRLGFIPAAAEYVYSKTLNAYGTYSKTLTPQFLQNQLLKPAESRVAEFASPVVASVQTGSLSLLANLDSKVDGTVSTMESMIKSALERWTALQSTGVAKFTDARSRALKTVQDFSKQVQKEGLLNSTAKIASEAVKPPVEFAKQTYVSVHDAVTASPIITQHMTQEKSCCSAQETSLYKGFAARVLPVISSVAGYELDAITKSQYYQVALQQLQPITIIKA